MHLLTIITALLILLLAVYCKLDPFHLSPIANYPNFQTFKVDLPRWSDIPKARDPHNLLRKSEIRFHNQVQGPESIAFDPLGRGPYTGVADGRVLFWNGRSWADFAHTSPNRTEICGFQESMSSYRKNEHICGRPLGLRFDEKSGELYIADAYFGLMKVGPEGGLATSLTKEAEGVPFMFTNDLDIDDDGNVYFTDSSSLFERRNFELLIYSGVASGRVLKYDPVTNMTTVLMRNMVFPNGLSLSKDGRFFVFTEAGRLRRYWLKGEHAGNSDIFAVLPGSADNVRVNENGEFWVAISSFHNKLTLFSAEHPKFRLFTLKLPIPANWQSWIYQMGVPLRGIVVKYSSEGKLLEILEDKGGEVVSLVSEVHEHNGNLWMGSVSLSHIAIYT